MSAAMSFALTRLGRMRAPFHGTFPVCQRLWRGGCIFRTCCDATQILQVTGHRRLPRLYGSDLQRSRCAGLDCQRDQEGSIFRIRRAFQTSTLISKPSFGGNFRAQTRCVKNLGKLFRRIHGNLRFALLLARFWFMLQIWRKS